MNNNENKKNKNKKAFIYFTAAEQLDDDIDKKGASFIFHR